MITPSFKSKWDREEDGICKLCLDPEKTANIKHILSGCQKSLEQKRYTWRHDKVLKQIYDQVLYHVEHRVNNPRRSTRTEQEGERIKFISLLVLGRRLKVLSQREEDTAIWVL